MEVEFFWGTDQTVALDRIELFRDYLASRQRVLSLTRADLCSAFFNNPLFRLREDRVKKIHATLHQHGFDFQPTHWPSPETRVQISLDDSVVSGGTSEKDAQFEALLPRWLQPQKLPPGSRDPMGFQVHAERLANELLPGLTVTTSRIGYYGFLAWAINHLNSSSSSKWTRQEALLRLERTLVLSEFVLHGASDNSCRMLGQRSKIELLQSADGDRFRVPKRILKNQALAGAYRLYFTSLSSLGFAEEDPDLGSEGLLPLTITRLGNQLAGAFESRVDAKFPAFALNDRTIDRETLRAWGANLCFSRLGSLSRYRKPFLDGLLLGNSPDAEKRYRTVQRLFKRRLLSGRYSEEPEEANVSDSDAVAEHEFSAAQEAPVVAGLSNDTVLLHFYEEPPRPDNRDFQAAAVFELLALGLSALFQAVVEELQQTPRLALANITARFAGERRYAKLWSSPIEQCVSRVPNARELVDRLFSAEKSNGRAAIGGLLLLRVLGDQPLTAVTEDLADTPALSLARDGVWLKPQRSLAEAMPELLTAMIEQHQKVSLNKSRQRWCFLDGDVVVKDDLQDMQFGFHAFRFPQLYSMCWDLGLQAEDLRHGV